MNFCIWPSAARSLRRDKSAAGESCRCVSGPPLVTRRKLPCRGGANSSQLAQRDFLDAVAFRLLEDEVGALAGRQDVVVQIDEIDPGPDSSRGRNRLVVGEPRIAVEIG